MMNEHRDQVLMMFARGEISTAVRDVMLGLIDAIEHNTDAIAQIQAPIDAMETDRTPINETTIDQEQPSLAGPRDRA